MCTLFCFRKSFLLATLFAFVAFSLRAQLPQPNLIYMNFGPTVVGGSLTPPSDSMATYNPALPVSATNPSHNTIALPDGTAGLAVSKVLGSSNNTLTFYTTVNLHYWYYDPVTSIWVDTGDSTGTSNTVNIGAGGGFIYSMQALGNFPSIYKYDGTGDATYLCNVFSGPNPYDVAVDCEGNFYIIRLIGPVWSMNKWSPAGVFMQTYTFNNPNNFLLSGGLAIIGNDLYADNIAQGIAHFSISGNTVNYVGVTPTVPFTQSGAGLSIGDFATVPFDASGTMPTLSVIVSDTVICNGNSVTFTSTSSAGGSPVQWNVNGIPVSGATSATFSYAPSDGDVITCEMIGNGGCSTMTIVSPPIEIHVQPAPSASFTLASSACMNDTVVAVVDTPLNINYQWNFGGATVLNGSGPGPYELIWNSAGNHSVSLQSGQGSCIATANKNIAIADAPTLQLATDNTTVCSGDTIGITALSANNNIQWLAGSKYVIVDAANNNANILPAQACTVLAKATNAAGCSTTKGIDIHMADNCCQLNIPSAFSPNADGLNDVFQPVGKHYNITSFKVFNRWGQLIFSRVNNGPGWNGSYKGAIQEMGTYYYELKYSCNGNTKALERKGDVTLIR